MLLFSEILFLRIICNVITFPNIQIFLTDLTNIFCKKFLFGLKWKLQPGQNISNKFEKSSKIGHKEKRLISTFTFFSTAIAKV